MNVPLARAPAGRRPWGVSLRGLVVALVLAALTTGAAVLEIERAQTRHGRLSADERAYLRLADDVLQTGRWGDSELKQPYRWAPGTPVLFAVSAALTGRRVTPRTARDTQIVVGTLLVPATFLLAYLLAGSAAGLVAAAAVAFYAPLVRAAATAGTETFGALMIVLACIALVLAVRQPRPPPLECATAGVVLGLAALVRGDLVPVAVIMPAVLAFVVARRGRRRDGAIAGAAMLAGAVVVMAPWSILTSRDAHRFIPVTDGGAANLFIGTDLPAGGTIFGVKRQFAAETRVVHPSLRHVKTFALRQEHVLDAVAAHYYPERSRDDALRAAAGDNLRRYALGRPVAFTGMEARKLWRMWGGAYAGTGHRPGALALWEHRVLAALALAGLIGGLAVTRDARLALLAVFLVITTAVDVAFVSEARHNVRLMPLLVAAGAAGWWLLSRRAPGRTRSDPPPAPGT